jgi:hypothetical protein
MEVRNLYAYAVVAVVDMITIVALMKSFKPLSHASDTIDKGKGKRYARGT